MQNRKKLRKQKRRNESETFDEKLPTSDSGWCDEKGTTRYNGSTSKVTSHFVPSGTSPWGIELMKAMGHHYSGLVALFGWNGSRIKKTERRAEEATSKDNIQRSKSHFEQGRLPSFLISTQTSRKQFFSTLYNNEIVSTDEHEAPKVNGSKPKRWFYHSRPKKIGSFSRYSSQPFLLSNFSQPPYFRMGRNNKGNSKAGKGKKRDRSGNQSANKSERLNDTKRPRDDGHLDSEKLEVDLDVSLSSMEDISDDKEKELLQEVENQAEHTNDDPTLPEDRTNFFAATAHTITSDNSIETFRSADESFDNGANGAVFRGRKFITSSPLGPVNEEFSLSTEEGEISVLRARQKAREKADNDIDRIMNQMVDTTIHEVVIPSNHRIDDVEEKTPELDRSLPPLLEPALSVKRNSHSPRLERELTPTQSNTYAEWKTVRGKRDNSYRNSAREHPYAVHLNSNRRSDNKQQKSLGKSARANGGKEVSVLFSIVEFNDYEMANNAITSQVQAANKVTVFLDGYPRDEALVKEPIKAILTEILQNAVEAFEEEAIRRGVGAGSTPIFPELYAKHGTLEVGCESDSAARFVLRTFENRTHAGLTRETRAVRTLDMEGLVPTFIITTPADTTWVNLLRVCERKLNFRNTTTWLLINEVRTTRNQRNITKFAVAMPRNADFRATLLSNPSRPEAIFYPTARREPWHFRYQLTLTELGEYFEANFGHTKLIYFFSFKWLALPEQGRRSPWPRTTCCSEMQWLISMRTSWATSKTWELCYQPPSRATTKMKSKNQWNNQLLFDTALQQWINIALLQRAHLKLHTKTELNLELSSNAFRLFLSPISHAIVPSRLLMISRSNVNNSIAEDNKINVKYTTELFTIEIFYEKTSAPLTISNTARLISQTLADHRRLCTITCATATGYG